MSIWHCTAYNRAGCPIMGLNVSGMISEDEALEEFDRLLYHRYPDVLDETEETHAEEVERMTKWEQYKKDLCDDIIAYDRAGSDYLVKGDVDVSNVFRQIAHELRRQLNRMNEMEDNDNV